MTVALDDLRGNRSDGQPEPLANALFDVWAKMRSIANRAGNFPDRHLRSGIAKTPLVALILGVPVGNFQAEGDGLGVNTVGAADLRSGAKFLRALSQRIAEFHQSLLR